MQVKKQIKVLQTEAKDVANKLNKEVVVVTKSKIITLSSRDTSKSLSTFLE
jgi:arabinogalactan endo-1,4-beta-galactosidase